MTTKAQAIADDVERLARSGMSRNRIAEKLGVAQGTVTKAAGLRGVSFDRAQTIAATEAVIHDARASRASLSMRLLAAGHAALDAFNLAISDPERSADARNYMTTAAVAVDKHLVLELSVQAARNLSAVDEWTAAMLGRTEADKTVMAEESDEAIAAFVAAEMGAARQLTASERTP